jgi:adenosylcobinamide-phosphate synthase
MPLIATGAVALALVLDLAVGEPRDAFHPVAWFGRLVGRIDREWPHPRLAGAVATLALPFVAALIVGALVAGVAPIHPIAGFVIAGLVLFVTTSLRSLLGTATRVIGLTGDDLPAARKALLALAGRDASDLSAGQVRSAAAESAAENLADGLVAPLGAFAVLAASVSLAGRPGLALPVGAAGAAWVKAVNTLDSMLGYHHKAVGGPSARLDDLVMWVPARASALLLAVAALSPTAVVRARRWARTPPSPNSGWPMATLAVAIDARFQKPGVYDLRSDAALPSVADARRGGRIVGVAGAIAYAAAGAIASVPEFLGSIEGVVAWF